MRSRYARGWLGGLALIVAGILFLAQNLNLVGPLSTPVWALIFAGASLVFLVTYFLSGIQSWGWLFPACILGAIAGVLGLVQAGLAGAFLGSLVLAGVALPFLAAFALDWRGRWWALIPAWSLLAIAGVVLVSETWPGEWVGGLVLWAIALPFLVVYLLDRTRWWAIIPGLVLAAIGTVVPLSAVLAEVWIGPLILAAGALPFLGLYLRDRTRSWALIPAFVLAAVAGLIPLAELSDGEWAGPYVLFAVALPFAVTYARSDDHWWAIIPAGLLASLGLASALAVVLPAAAGGTPAWLNGLVFLGWAATFTWVWLRPRKQPQAWARFPALGCALAAAVAPIAGLNFDLVWPVLLIAGGLAALWTTLRPGRGPRPHS